MIERVVEERKRKEGNGRIIRDKRGREGWGRLKL